MNYHLTVKSENRKTGPIAVTTSSKSTCPDLCPLKKTNLCYAVTTQLRYHWQNVTNGRNAINFNELCSKIKELPDNQLIRHNQAGDLFGTNNKINGRQLATFDKAVKNKRCFTYSHKQILGNSFTSRKNRKHIRGLKNMVVNLSANNVAHADKLKALNIAPVVTILPLGSPNTLFTPRGNKVIVCPAQYRENVTCESCRLCQNKNRNVIIGFLAHSQSKKRVSEIASFA